jgi:hypothetical protein
LVQELKDFGIGELGPLTIITVKINMTPTWLHMYRLFTGYGELSCIGRGLAIKLAQPNFNQFGLCVQN